MSERIELRPLGPAHVDAILEGQDAELAHEAFGVVWTRELLTDFCARAARWTQDGPLREYAAIDERGAVVGGGGLHLLGHGIERGEVDAAYWVLAGHRGRGVGGAIARALRSAAAADPRLRTLVLRIAPDNACSRAVALGIGATPTGAIERHPADPHRTVERWELDLDTPRASTGAQIP